MDQALKFLLDTVFGLLTYAFLLRFVMQWLRAPFRNPLGQAVIALTDWAVKPLRRVLPGFAWSSTGRRWSLAWLTQFAVARGDSRRSWRPRRARRGGRARRSRCSRSSNSSRPRSGS